MAENGEGSRNEQKNNEAILTEESLSSILSDAGKYSYARLCSIILCSLYSAKHERKWVKASLCDLLKHIGLPYQAQKTLVDRALCELNNDTNTPSLPYEYESITHTLKYELQHEQQLVVLSKDMVIFALKSGKYDARNRVLIYSVADQMGISRDDVEDVEDQLVVDLKVKKSQQESQEDELRRKEEKARKLKRNVLIGLGAIAGGTIIGLTGGLAAPFIAAGAGTLLGGGAAVALASIKGLAIITSLFGAAGAGLTGYRMNRRLGDTEEFEFEKLTEGEHLHLALAVSGWLEKDEDMVKESGFKEPWGTMKLAREQYCLQWESRYLAELGTAISSFLTTGAIAFATEEAIKHTVLQVSHMEEAGLRNEEKNVQIEIRDPTWITLKVMMKPGILSAITWPLGLLKLGYVIDNPWSVCAERASEVGKHLAKVLMEKQQGHRPVSLIGFSFGARVIFHCLKALSDMKGSEGIIQEAILLGAPVTADASKWECLETVVAGRVINGYCSNDWLLKFAYRTATAQMTIAGLRPVRWMNRRMINVDLSDLVKGHADYGKPEVMEHILNAIVVGSTRPSDYTNNGDDYPDDFSEARSNCASPSDNDSGISSFHGEASRNVASSHEQDEDIIEKTNTTEITASAKSCRT